MAKPLEHTLATQGLSRRFGEHLVVDAITLAVDAGEVYGLLGRNGAGKSTLIKMLTTLLPPSSGTASIGRPAVPNFLAGNESRILRRLRRKPAL